MGTHDFGWAIQQLKAGHAVCRQNWDGADQAVRLQRHAKGTLNLPYIYIGTAWRDLVPWSPSQTDMLAEDWSIIDEVE